MLVRSRRVSEVEDALRETSGGEFAVPFLDLNADREDTAAVGWPKRAGGALHGIFWWHQAGTCSSVTRSNRDGIDAFRSSASRYFTESAQ